MGADLIGIVLAIPADRKPDWQAAHTHVDNMLPGDLRNPSLDTYLDITNINDTLNFIRRGELLHDAVDYVKKDLTTPPRNTFRACLNDLDIYVLAEMSWGDTPDGFNEWAAFYDSGAAQAAGFKP